MSLRAGFRLEGAFKAVPESGGRPRGARGASRVDGERGAAAELEGWVVAVSYAVSI